MSIITISIAAVTGAVFNRLRGAGIGSGKLVNALAFGAAVLMILGPVWALCLMPMMYIGSAPGWGRYIGALGGWEDEELEEYAPIDWLARLFRPERKVDPSRGFALLYPKRQLQLWGFVTLSMRGAFWGLCIGAGAVMASLITNWQNWSEVWHTVHAATQLIAYASLMGLVYAASLAGARSLNNKDQSWRGEGWEAGEVGFGAILWGACAATLMTGETPWIFLIFT